MNDDKKESTAATVVIAENEESVPELIDESSVCTNEETATQSIDEDDTPQPSKWLIDNQFKNELTRLRISDDPKEW